MRCYRDIRDYGRHFLMTSGGWVTSRHYPGAVVYVVSYSWAERHYAVSRAQSWGGHKFNLQAIVSKNVTIMVTSFSTC